MGSYRRSPSVAGLPAAALACLFAAAGARAEIIVQPGFASASGLAFSDRNGNLNAEPEEIDSPPAVTGTAASFDETVSVDEGPAHGGAAIRSSVSGSGAALVATASGRCRAEAPLPPGPLVNGFGPHQAHGAGDVEIRFTTSAPARFSILATASLTPVSAPEGGNNRATVLGSFGEGVDILAHDQASDSVNESGALEPGEHVVDLACFVEAPRDEVATTLAPQVEARFSLLLTVTEEACEGTLHRWVAGAAGPFADPASWDPPEVPAFSGDADCDTALFENEGTVTLDLGGALSRGAARGVGVERRTGRQEIRSTQTLRPVGGTLILDSFEPGIDGRSLEIGSAKLLLDAGGVRARHVIVGQGGDGELEVVGPDGFFATQGRLGIGGDADGLVTITDAAQVTSAEAVLGEGDGAGSATVQGAGTLWQTGNLAVGFADDAGLTIEGGARVESGNAFVDCGIAAGPGTPGCPGMSGDERATATVTGAAGSTPSTWALTGELEIGGRGKVTVEGGALLDPSLIRIGTSGSEADCLAGRACLEVTDGSVSSDGIAVGVSGAGKLRVAAAGRVAAEVAGVVVGGFAGSRGEVVVTGPSAEAQIDADLSVGTTLGGQGEVLLQSGAQVSIPNGSIGGEPGSSGLVEILGAGAAPGATVLRVTGSPESRLVLGVDLAEPDASVFGATGELALADGRLELEDADLEILNTGAVTGIGRIDGFGVSFVSNDGHIGCGVVVGANYTQGPDGVLTCPAATSAAGAAPQLNPLAATSFARSLARRAKPPPPPPFPGPFVVEGDATLDGTLVLQFLNGFAPRTGDAFELLDVSGALTGGFADVVVRGLAPGFEFAEDPVGGRLTLTSLNDAEPLPAVSLKAKPTLKEKKKKGLKVKVSRAGDTSQALAVRYAIRGTARNGIDYNLLPGEVEIPARKKSAKLLIRPVPEGLEEGPETIELEVLPGESYAPSLAAKIAVEIEDGDGEVKKPRRP